MEPEEIKPSIPPEGLCGEAVTSGIDANPANTVMTPHERMQIEEMSVMGDQVRQEDLQRDEDMDVMATIWVYDLWDDLGM